VTEAVTIGPATLYLGDALNVLPGLESESVDAIVTDPPYGIPVGAAFVQKGGTVVGDGAGGFNATTTPYDWIATAATLLVDAGHVAFFIDRATSVEAELACRSAGLSVWQKFYLVKSTPAPTPRPTFASGVEECLIAEKRSGRRRWYGGGYVPNRWIGKTPNAMGEAHDHDSEKPLAPIATLVASLAPEGGLVLDSFMGTGTTGVACVREGRRFVGIEKDPQHFKTACQRVREAWQADRSSLFPVFSPRSLLPLEVAS
jgi:site-specific DNA-methyltransferase (adenine-specific)